MQSLSAPPILDCISIDLALPNTTHIVRNVPLVAFVTAALSSFLKESKLDPSIIDTDDGDLQISRVSNEIHISVETQAGQIVTAYEGVTFLRAIYRSFAELANHRCPELARERTLLIGLFAIAT